MTDWATIRMQYEIFGTDVQTLAKEGSTTVPMIQYAIEKEGWSRQALANIPEAPSEEIMEGLQSKMDMMFTLKQANFQDRFLKLESQVVSKAIEIVKGIQSDHPTAAAQLRTINQVLSALKEESMLDGGKKRNAEGEGGLKLMIVNQFGDKLENRTDDEPITIEIDGTQVLSN